MVFFCEMQLQCQGIQTLFYTPTTHVVSAETSSQCTVTTLHSMNFGDATHSAVQLLLCVCFSAKKITLHTVCAAMGKGFGLLIVHKQNFIHTISHGVICNC